MHKNGYLMLWLFVFGLFAAIFFVGYDQGFLSFDEIMKMDGTGTTIIIILYYLAGLGFNISDLVWLQITSGKNLRALQRDQDKLAAKFKKRSDIAYYFNSVLPLLGFLGTLIGFMIVYNLFQQNIVSEKELAKMVEHILVAVGGLKTAAFTTIAGLVFSGIILAPLDLIFRNGYIELIVEKVNEGGADENTRQQE